jgi:hypothetical protein
VANDEYKGVQFAIIIQVANMTEAFIYGWKTTLALPVLFPICSSFNDRLLQRRVVSNF